MQAVRTLSFARAGCASKKSWEGHKHQTLAEKWSLCERESGVASTTRAERDPAARSHQSRSQRGIVGLDARSRSAGTDTAVCTANRSLGLTKSALDTETVTTCPEDKCFFYTFT